MDLAQVKCAIVISLLASFSACTTSTSSEIAEVAEETPTRTICNQIGQNDTGTVTVTYAPDGGYLTPYRVEWKGSFTDEKEGDVNLYGFWQSGTYLNSFAEQAQFVAELIPRKTGPKLARVEIHPWAYRYNHWGMRYGATSTRGQNNEYFASAFWPSLVDIEQKADKLSIRVQKITSDTANNNYPGNATMSVELPENLFQQATGLVEETIEKGNALMLASKADCIQETNPPFVVN